MTPPLVASDDVEEEAAAWLERLERTLKREEIEAFRTWLKPKLHRETIVSRCRLWHGPDILAILGEIIPLENFSSRVERQYGRIVLAIFLGVSGIGFTTVMIAFSKLLPGTDAHLNPLRAEASYQTPPGGRLRLQLPDGGAITLNSDTRLLLSYAPHSRDVTLLRGEASFDVIDDVARPFRVHAAPRSFDATVRSSFNLHRVGKDQVELIVMEGEVTAAAGGQREALTPAQLRWRPSYGAHTFSASRAGMLGAGWQVERLISNAELRDRLAWRDHSSPVD